jgi:hypothetical protein
VSEPAEQTAGARPVALTGPVGRELENVRKPGLRYIAENSTPEVTADVVSRLGQPLRVRISCAALKDRDGARGAILVMEEVDRGES